MLSAYQTGRALRLCRELTLAREGRHTHDIVSLAWPARVPAIVAAFAVALMGLLPDAHVHTGGDRKVVHRHVISEAATHQHAQAIGHQSSHDHADAIMLTDFFDASRQGSSGAGIVATPWFLADAASADAQRVSGKTLLPTHDPPLRFMSSPAPPAVV